MERVAARYASGGIRVVTYSQEIPEFSICAGPSLPDRDERILSDALMALNADQSRAATVLRSIDSHYTGFVTASDGEFNGIRTIMRELGLS